MITTAGSSENARHASRSAPMSPLTTRLTISSPQPRRRPVDRGADVILDMVGGEYIDRNYDAAAVEGRIVQIAFQASPRASVDFRRLMFKRLTHTGSTLRARSIADKAAIARAVETKVLPLIAAGKVKPAIDSTFKLHDAAAAHARMERSEHIGKIVLTL